MADKSFHQEWEVNEFQRAKEDGYPYPKTARYPYDLVVSVVGRNFFSVPQQERANIRMLDVGCGGGNNAAFMAENGFSVFGVDGSPTAIEIGKDRFAKRGLQGSFVVGDLLELPYEDNTFDFALDRESISMNRPEHIKGILQEVKRVLKPGGLLCSFTYSTDHPGREYGEEVEPNTYSNFKKGAFEGRGIAHFFDMKELLEVYGILRIQNILKLSLGEVYDKQNPLTEWTEYIILARK